MITGCLRAGPPGRYVLQAAIASLYAEPPSYGQTDWRSRPILLGRLGRTREATAAYRQALALAANDAERAFLEEQIAGPRPAGTA